MCRYIGILFFAALMIGGCVSNTNPVLKPQQLITDKALVGKWIERDKDQNTTLDVQPPGEDKSAKVLFANVNNDDNKQHEAIVRLGKIKDLEVVEFKLKPEDRDHAGQAPYVWAVIRHADAKSVTADVMDVNWLKKYAADHPGELATKPDPDDNSIIITASTDDFQKFLLAHEKDDGAFNPTRWVRPGSPATQPAPPVGGL